MNQSKQASTHHNRLGCLIFVTSILAIFQFLRLFYLLETPATLIPHLIPPHTIQLFSASMWFVILATLSVTLALQKDIALRYGVWVVIIFVGYRIGWVAVFVQADYDRQREPLIWLLATPLLIMFMVKHIRKNSRTNNTNER